MLSITFSGNEDTPVRWLTFHWEMNEILGDADVSIAYYYKYNYKPATVIGKYSILIWFSNSVKFYYLFFFSISWHGHLYVDRHVLSWIHPFIHSLARLFVHITWRNATTPTAPTIAANMVLIDAPCIWTIIIGTLDLNRKVGFRDTSCLICCLKRTETTSIISKTS